MDRADKRLCVISRREFIRAGAASGIALSLTRLAAADEPFAAHETMVGLGAARLEPSGDPEQQGVRSLRRPARHIGGTKIGSIELGPGSLCDAVDPSAA
jgi:hypothetical protein